VRCPWCWSATAVRNGKSCWSADARCIWTRGRPDHSKMMSLNLDFTARPRPIFRHGTPFGQFATKSQHLPPSIGPSSPRPFARRPAPWVRHVRATCLMQKVSNAVLKNSNRPVSIVNVRKDELCKPETNQPRRIKRQENANGRSRYETSQTDHRPQ
jgi:hypothetical protein